MSSFLQRLAQRAQGETPAVAPRRPSRFEPEGGVPVWFPRRELQRGTVSGAAEERRTDPGIRDDAEAPGPPVEAGSLPRLRPRPGGEPDPSSRSSGPDIRRDRLEGSGPQSERVSSGKPPWNRHDEARLATPGSDSRSGSLTTSEGEGASRRSLERGATRSPGSEAANASEGGAAVHDRNNWATERKRAPGASQQEGRSGIDAGPHELAVRGNQERSPSLNGAKGRPGSLRPQAEQALSGVQPEGRASSFEDLSPAGDRPLSTSLGSRGPRRGVDAGTLRAGEGRRRSGPVPETTVQVTIGSIEVRTVQPQLQARPQPGPAPPKAGPQGTLEDYLRRRREGGR